MLADGSYMAKIDLKSAYSADACISGGAGFYGGDWFYVHWEADEPHMCDSHINEKELYTILLTAPAHRLLSCDTSESCHILDSEASMDTDIQRFRCIVGYLNIIRILHQEAGYENPLEDNWLLQTTLRGIRRHHGDSDQHPARHPQQTGFLPGLPCSILGSLCGCFLLVLYKSNVLPKTAKDFDATKQMCRKDFRFFDRGAVITVRWSKTIQFKERTVLIPIARITDSPLCPTTAVEKAFSLTDTAEPDRPAFVLPQETGPGFTPLTHKPFVTTLRTLLSQCGYPDSAYSGHSFRRGAATWASECGLQPELIKLQGDWKSCAYQRYTSVSLKSRLWTVKTMANALH
ncbi:LOW QUALITY PROTEIN: uncharacterized protein LOC144924455 [Branchiostoma floridae x Branchiostoma belcheri]